MSLQRTSNRLSTETLQGPSRLFVLCGRILLSIACLLLAIMPITEHLWTFDKFLQGGPDLELGLFTLISILCLVVVLSRHRRQGVTILLAIRQFLARHLYAKLCTYPAHTNAAHTPPLDDSSLPRLFLSTGNLPLQV